MQLVKQRQFPVQWHEGMLLSPQHFQQDQAYHENERMHQLSLLAPYFWGLVQLRYDGTSLLSGMLRIRSLYGMMPDGLVVNHDDKLDAELTIDLTSSVAFEREGAEALVHLVVPIRDKGAAHQLSEIQRFDSMTDNAPVVDENTGENGVEVYRLKPRLSLFVGDTPPGKYVAMPIMRVKRENDGTFKHTRYVPPVRSAGARDITSAAALFTNLERLVQGIRQKAIQLAGISASEASGLTRSVRMRKREMSEILGAVLPSLELVLNSDIHPFDVYRTFCDAIGKLTRLTANPVPPVMPIYDHNDLNVGFSSVISWLASLISTIKSEFHLLKFDQQDTLFSIMLLKQNDTDTLTIELRGERGVTDKALMEYVKSVRIVSESKLDTADQKRLLGAQRRILAKPIFESESDQERVVIVIDTTDSYIRFGERLVIRSASQRDDDILPESIWLYTS